jgi:hypothetical protein
MFFMRFRIENVIIHTTNALGTLDDMWSANPWRDPPREAPYLPEHTSLMNATSTPGFGRAGLCRPLIARHFYETLWTSSSRIPSHFPSNTCLLHASPYHGHCATNHHACSSSSFFYISFTFCCIPTCSQP